MESRAISPWVQILHPQTPFVDLSVTHPKERGIIEMFLFVCAGVSPPHQKWSWTKKTQSSHKHYLPCATVYYSPQHNCCIVDFGNWEGKKDIGNTLWNRCFEEDVSHLSMTPFSCLLPEFFHGCLFGNAAVVRSVVATTTSQRNQKPRPLKSFE